MTAQLLVASTQLNLK